MVHESLDEARGGGGGWWCHRGKRGLTGAEGHLEGGEMAGTADLGTRRIDLQFPQTQSLQKGKALGKALKVQNTSCLRAAKEGAG
jgi:hypothetical protein